MRVGVARDHHQAGGVAIEAMNDPGARRIAASEELGEQLDERRSPGPGRRMDHQPWRLLDHREVRVDMDEPRIAAHGSVAPGPGSGDSAESAMIATPTVIDTSARLNAGQ